MVFHIIQAQHSSPVVVTAAFVFLLHASAQLVLDHLKVDKDRFTPAAPRFCQNSLLLLEGGGVGFVTQAHMHEPSRNVKEIDYICINLSFCRPYA